MKNKIFVMIQQLLFIFFTASSILASQNNDLSEDDKRVIEEIKKTLSRRDFFVGYSNDERRFDRFMYDALFDLQSQNYCCCPQFESLFHTSFCARACNFCYLNFGDDEENECVGQSAGLFIPQIFHQIIQLPWDLIAFATGPFHFLSECEGRTSGRIRHHFQAHYIKNFQEMLEIHKKILTNKYPRKIEKLSDEQLKKVLIDYLKNEIYEEYRYQYFGNPEINGHVEV